MSNESKVTPGTSMYIIAAIGGVEFNVEQLTVLLQLNRPASITATLSYRSKTSTVAGGPDLYAQMAKVSVGDPVTIKLTSTGTPPKEEDPVGADPVTGALTLKGFCTGWTSSKFRHLGVVRLHAFGDIGALWNFTAAGSSDTSALAQMLTPKKSISGMLPSDKSVLALLKRFTTIPLSVTEATGAINASALPVVMRAAAAQMYGPGTTVQKVLAAIAATDSVYSPSITGGRIVPYLPVFTTDKEIPKIPFNSVEVVETSLQPGNAASTVGFMPLVGAVVDAEPVPGVYTGVLTTTLPSYAATSKFSALDTASPAKLRASGYSTDSKTVDKTYNGSVDDTLLADVMDCRRLEAAYVGRTCLVRGNYAVTAANVNIRPGYPIQVEIPYSIEAEKQPTEFYTGMVVSTGFTVGQKEIPTSWILCSHLRNPAEQKKVSVKLSPLHQSSPLS